MRWLVLFLVVALAKLCIGVPTAPSDSESLHETVRAYLNSGGRELYQKHMDLAPGVEYNPLGHFHVDHAPSWYSRERTSELEILRALRLHVPGLDSESTISKGDSIDLDTTERQVTENIRGTLSSYRITFLNQPPPDVREAFLFAIRIWARTFPCTTQLRVQFAWQTFARTSGQSDPGTLAAALAPFSVVGGGNGLQYGVSYTPTMATCITGKDTFRGSSEYHIRLLFNAEQQWWTDVRRDAPLGRFDFATVALHELCHGLFFSGALHIEDIKSVNVKYQSQGSLPARFDQFIQMSNGVGIARSCNQRELFLALTRRGLSFRTSEEKSTFWLFAPELYRPGSSTYHLDSYGLKQSCARYAIPNIDCSDLMTFELNPGYTQHAVGEPVLRIMRSILGTSAGLVESDNCNVPAPLSGPTGTLGALDQQVNVGPFRVKRWVIIVACSIAAVGASLVIYFIATAVLNR